MHLPLACTGQRCLVEASPHDKLWIIDLSAYDYSASTPDTWRDFNLLGQALEYAREIIRQETMPPISNSILPDTTVPMDHSSDAVFKVDGGGLS